MWAGGHHLKVQEDVFAPSHFPSPFPFPHTLEGIILLLAYFISVPSCVMPVWKWTSTTHAAAKPSWQYFLLTSGEGDPYSMHPV